MYDIDRVTTNLYDACTAYEQSEYTETKETDLKQLHYALECVADYACYNDHFKVLAECLRAVFDN